MPIPDFQTIMLPLLELHSDQKEHSSKDLINAISDKFSLTMGELSEKLGSGVLIINNRVG